MYLDREGFYRHWKELTLSCVPVDGVKDYGTGDDRIYINIWLPESCINNVGSGHHDLHDDTCGGNQLGVEDGGTEWQG